MDKPVDELRRGGITPKIQGQASDPTLYKMLYPKGRVISSYFRDSISFTNASRVSNVSAFNSESSMRIPNSSSTISASFYRVGSLLIPPRHSLTVSTSAGKPTCENKDVSINLGEFFSSQPSVIIETPYLTPGRQAVPANKTF
jgi:hypothetical protein